MVKYKELSYMGQLKYEAERDEKRYRKWLKNGISEIIKLLNEWSEYEEKEYGFRNYEWVLSIRGPQAKRLCIPNEYLSTEESEVIMISKSYGFIKRLVDNDKIDHKIYEDMKFTAIKQGALIDKKSGSTAQETREIIKNGCIDTFIALLAISDTPIQDLCVWLK